MIYLFLDTNIFIHFKNFEDIPWNKILNCKKDDVEIAVAPIVIDELDKHKYNSNPKVAHRIKKLMPKFHEILSNRHSKGLKVQFISERPNISIFNDNMLDRSQQDDCLLASILYFKKHLNLNDKVFYVTNDFGPKIKAKSLSIDVLPIPEEYLIENDLTEEQKLKKENERLKNLFPKLDIFFKESQDIIYEVKKEKFNVSKELIIDSKMKEIKRDFPLLTYTIPTNNFSSLSNLKQEQVINYNRDLNTFFNAFEKYWDVLCDSILYDNNLIKLNIVIENNGSTPAEDIDIVLQFPLHINILLKENLDYFRTIEPFPPHKPESAFDIYQLINKYYIKESSITRKKPEPRNSIEFNFQALKHNKAIELDTLFIPSNDLSKGFKIDYSILVSNIPNPVKGELNIKFGEATEEK